MAASSTITLLASIRRLAAPAGLCRLADRELLDRFATRHDDAAFAVLVRRHGGMVLRTCRRILSNVHDAEDAFQATFLVLARKAGSLPWSDSVGPWLHAVAHRSALKLLRVDIPRRTRPHLGPAPGDPLAEISGRELLTLFEEELSRLPEKYRAPLVLCHLEGRTQDEAARQLGWSLSTLKRRLAAGRDRLKVRLTRRGLVLSAALAAVEVANAAGPAAVSAGVLHATARASVLALTGEWPPAGLVSPKAVGLAEGVLQAMFWTKVKSVSVSALLMLASALGVGGVALGTGFAQEPRLRFEGGWQELAKRDTTSSLARSPLQFEGPVLSVAFSPNGKLLAAGTGAEDSTISIRETTTGKEVRRFRGHEGRVAAVAFSPDGRILASGSYDGTVRLWDVAAGREILRFAGHTDKVDALAFSPDGRTLASGGHDQVIRLWEAATGKERHRLEGHSDVVMALVFTPDGKTLVSGSGDETIRLWAVATGTPVRQVNGQPGWVTGLALSPDGKTLASGGADKVVHLWDLATGVEIAQLAGHQDEVQSVVFTPDGSRLASSGRDQTIRLWNVATGRIEIRFAGHEERVRSLAVSPDGKTLASGSWDQSVRLWGLAGKKP